MDDWLIEVEAVDWQTYSTTGLVLADDELITNPATDRVCEK